MIIPNLSKNGPIIYVRYLLEGLKYSEVEVDVYSFDIENTELFHGIEITKLGFFNTLPFENYDIVHTHTIKADLYGLMNYKSISDKWVITIHNLYKADLKYLYRPLKAFVIQKTWRRAFDRCRNIVVFSDSMLKYYLTDIGKKNYGIIRTGVPEYCPNLVANEEIRRIDLIKKDCFIIGASGHLIRRKGFAQLIELLAFREDCALVITGSGPERNRLMEQAISLGVEDRLILLGFKENPLDYYQFYDVFALPSYAEGLPLALLEAFEQGIPVLCSKLDNYRDHFTDEEVAFFDLDDIQSLKFALSKLLDNRKHYGYQSKNLYVKKFSVEVMARKHITYYSDLLR